MKVGRVKFDAMSPKSENFFFLFFLQKLNCKSNYLEMNAANDLKFRKHL